MVEWWYYLVAVPAAAFVVNSLPYLVHGVSGQQFPTPLSGGAGTLDGAVRNVFWGAGNLIVGCVLFSLIWSGMSDPILLWGSVALAVILAALLGHLFVHRERRKPGKLA
jgi:hypothetical protein